MFALVLSHYSQNPESPSNVVYSFASLPLELIQYDYDLGDCDCSTITPLSLLPNIHTCSPGSNGFKVAICSMTYIKNFLTVGFPHCLSQTTLYSDMEGCNWLSNMGKVVNSLEVLKMKIHYEVINSNISLVQCMGHHFFKQALNGFHSSLYFPVTSKDSVGCLLCGWHHILLQISCIHGMNMRVHCQIQLLEVPMPSKDWFCERLSQKKTAHSIYLFWYTWSNNQQ